MYIILDLNLSDVHMRIALCQIKFKKKKKSKTTNNLEEVPDLINEKLLSSILNCHYSVRELLTVTVSVLGARRLFLAANT